MSNLMVSIDCIVYNQEKFIGKALDGFISQKTNFKFEILVHDDASTDKTQSIIKEYEQKYPGLIKPIYRSENQHSKGINPSDFNLNRAQGKYIALCEGDDYWIDPYKLQKQVDFMEKNPEYSLIAHQSIKINTLGKNLGNFSPFSEGEVTIEDFLKQNGGYFPTASLIIKKEVLSNGYPEFYTKAPIGDWPLTLWCGIHGKMYFLNDVMSVYRVGVDSSWSKKMATDIQFYIDVTYGILEMLELFNNYTNRKYNYVLDIMFNYYRKLLYIHDREGYINKGLIYQDIKIELENILLKVPKNRKIYLFGASKLGKSFLKLLKENNIVVEGFLDNSLIKIGTEFEQLPIYHLDEFKNKDNYQILITSAYASEIEKQLLKFGLVENIDFINIKKKLLTLEW